MAVLNDFQKVDRVINGLPFGNGEDGDAGTISSDNWTRRGCSGSASSTTLTIDSSGFSNGDLVLIIKSRGNTTTTAGSWEINQVESGGGTTSLTLKTALNYAYQNSADNQSQVIKMPMYETATLGNITLDAWNSSEGGIIGIVCKDTLTIGGTINAEGKGYDGGAVENPPSYHGEGTAGESDTRTTSANGNGGGGYGDGANGSSGAGGGHASAGQAGGAPSGGTAGAAVGDANLKSLNFGGGGGGGNYEGGHGGGVIVLIAKTITYSSGSMRVDGDDGDGSGGIHGAGGGAGGSILMMCKDATLDTTKFTAYAGAGYKSGDSNGGNGSVGRIAVHTSGTVTGTTSPTLVEQADTSLVEKTGNFLAFL